MIQWFYVKNDLDKREDISDVIQWPIRSRFGIKSEREMASIFSIIDFGV
jgi:hypothetical protein